MSELVTRYVCGDDEQCGVCVECAMLSQGAELEGMRQRVADLEKLLRYSESFIGQIHYAASQVNFTDRQDWRGQSERLLAAMAQQKEGVK